MMASKRRGSLMRQGGVNSSGSDSLVPSESSLCPESRQRKHSQPIPSLSLPSGITMEHEDILAPNSLSAVIESSPRLRRQSTIETKKVQKDDEEETVNQYRILGKLGQGAYGIVREAQGGQDGSRYAIKIMSKNRLSKIARKKMFRRPPPGRGRGPNGRPAQESELLKQVKREIAILKNLDHPNIITLNEVIDDPNQDDLYMVFELCENGPVMGEQMEPFDEETSLGYFVDLMLGVEYLHSQNIIHRDIKPENLLLDDKKEHIKIADFGVSEWFSDLEQHEMVSKTAGSPAFMAPESVISEPGQQLEFSGKPTDIWAMGVTLYCFIYGRLPFQSPGIVELYSLIRTAEPEFPDDVEISADLRDFFTRLLEKDPMKRITLDGMRNHPWIQCVEGLPSTADNCTPPEDVSEDEVSEVFSNLTISELCSVIENIRTQAFRRLSVSRAKSMERSYSVEHSDSTLSMSPSQSLSASLGRNASLLDSTDISVDFSPESSLVSISTMDCDDPDGPAMKTEHIDFRRLTPQQNDIVERLSSPSRRRRREGRWGDRSRSPSPMPARQCTTPEIMVEPASPLPRSPSVPVAFN